MNQFQDFGLTDCKILFECCNAISHFIVIKIRFNISDLDIGFQWVKLALFDNFGVVNNDQVLLAILVAIELL